VVRNAWMLKCQRVILGPAHPSRYGKLRREPRRDGLSTIEAAAMLLAGIESGPISPRRCTTVSSACWQNIGRRKARCRSLRPSRTQARLPPPQTGLMMAADGVAGWNSGYPRDFSASWNPICRKKKPCFNNLRVFYRRQVRQSAPNWRNRRKGRLKHVRR